MAAARLVVCGFLWALMCGCVGGAAGLQDAYLAAVLKRLDSVEQQLQAERTDTAALRARVTELEGSQGTALGPLDVRRFGAVADDGLDDTPSIQAALDAAVRTGGTVHVPTGDFSYGR
jgi:polygalacturonase